MIENRGYGFKAAYHVVLGMIDITDKPLKNRISTESLIQWENVRIPLL